MSDAASRADVSAWQRWEMASFEPSGGRRNAAAGRKDEPDPAALLQAQMDAVRTQAQEQGLREGYAAGIAQANAERQRLQQLLATVADHAGAHQQELADEVLDLALVLARQIAGDTLEVRRELLLPIVGEALKQLPQSTQRVNLQLNPADVELVRTFLDGDIAAPQCRLVPDPSIAAGGCRIISDQCAIDATTPTRWQRILGSLGRPEDWLDQA